ncbi:hypothetical protein ACFU8I_20170, partial [Streptomyces sp. NPDC057540]|uniref:hypothetical protein n=1 Tax=Streptomyces sp. NPDC057540 TaxID=3346160 RepID=UPI0036AB7774
YPPACAYLIPMTYSRNHNPSAATPTLRVQPEYDTAEAVSHNDQDAEKRVSEYCAAVGFETLMKYL